MSDIEYGYWRLDKPAEEGFSHELISVHTDRDQVDDLNVWPVSPVDGIEIMTITQGLD